MSTEVCIVGAGILGLSLALHLADEGCNSRVLERELLPGRHASSKNAGMFRQLYRNSQLTDWAMRSPDLWPEQIRERCFTETGSYVVGRQSPGHHKELFSDRQVDAGPRGKVQAVYSKRDGLLDSKAFLPLLAEGLRTKSCTQNYGCEVLSATWQDGVWQIRTSEETFECSRLVIGNGAWVSRLPVFSGGSSLTPSVETLKPYARHLFVVDGFSDISNGGSDGQPDWGFYWNELDHWYMRKWGSSTRLFSICDEIASNPDTYEPQSKSREQLEAVLGSFFPESGPALRIRDSWHCFRTYTPDQLPVWGPDPRQDNLFWLAGFGGFGMSTGFAAAKDLARLMSGGQSAVSSDVIITRLLATHTG